MSQIDQIVKNITLENKKCNYNPEIDMNWCKLPMEMRNECVKRMGFMTRTRLGATSKTEKSLIAHQKKFEFDLVEFYLSNNECTLWPFSDTIRFKNLTSTNVFLAILLYRYNIENFGIRGTNEYKFSGILEQLANFAPLPFKRVSVFGNPSLNFFIENCPNLEKLDVSGDRFPFPGRQILEAPNFMNIKEFRYSNLRYESFRIFLEKMVKKWIANDAEVGKSIQFHMKGRPEWLGLFNAFARKFRSRIIEKTDKEVRIRMNNPKTQILFRHLGTRVVQFIVDIIRSGRRPYSENVYFSCKVVPIDMPESEYANGDGWIQAVYEKGLKRDGKLENAMKFDAEDQAVWGEEYCMV